MAEIGTDSVLSTFGSMEWNSRLVTWKRIFPYGWDGFEIEIADRPYLWAVSE